MEITLFNQTENTLMDMYVEEFEKIAKRCSKVLKVNDGMTLSVIYVTPQQIQEINRDYRNLDRPTDVISFALKDSEDDYVINEEIDEELGDIFINLEAVKNQAAEYGHSEKREICFLFTHGLLHLLGYDHMNEEDEQIMFALQDVILDALVPKA